jgi:cell division protein FtsA
MSRIRIGAVDLGSTKVSALLGEIDQSGLIHIKGIGIAESTGIRHGTVTELQGATQSLVKAVELAEEMAGEKMPPIHVGISGDHIQGMAGDGGVSFTPDDPTVGHDIVLEDVERALESAKAVQLPLDKSLLHAIPQEFQVDDHSMVPNPVGMVGFRLRVKAHLVLGAITSQTSLKRVVELAGQKLGGPGLHPPGQQLLRVDPRGEGDGLRAHRPGRGYLRHFLLHQRGDVPLLGVPFRRGKPDP